MILSGGEDCKYKESIIGICLTATSFTVQLYLGVTYSRLGLAIVPSYCRTIAIHWCVARWHNGQSKPDLLWNFDSCWKQSRANQSLAVEKLLPLSQTENSRFRFHISTTFRFKISSEKKIKNRLNLTFPWIPSSKIKIFWLFLLCHFFKLTIEYGFGAIMKRCYKANHLLLRFIEFLTCGVACPRARVACTPEKFPRLIK